MIVGLPRIHKEPGELRDFLPDFVSFIAHSEVSGVVIEHGYGQGMGFGPNDYLRRSPKIKIASYEDCYRQDVVIVLRAPDEIAIEMMRPDALLVSMLHYGTHQKRNEAIIATGIHAVSLDSLLDDRGRRVVENMAAVGWNAMEVAFVELSRRYVGFDDPSRPPIRVAVLGSGAVAGSAAFAAARYGDQDLRARMTSRGVLGVETTLIDHDLTSSKEYTLEVLRRSDIIVDATRRPDPTKSVIPNHWLASLPAHAVIADLAADPYDFAIDPPLVKAIEGIPHGDLDHYVFSEEDPAFETLGAHVDVRERRLTLSCYSWPGIHPRDCMDLYGSQIATFLQVILSKSPDRWEVSSDDHMERSLARAEIRRWMHTSLSSR